MCSWNGRTIRCLAVRSTHLVVQNKYLFWHYVCSALVTFLVQIYAFVSSKKANIWTKTLAFCVCTSRRMCVPWNPLIARLLITAALEFTNPQKAVIEKQNYSLHTRARFLQRRACQNKFVRVHRSRSSWYHQWRVCKTTLYTDINLIDNIRSISYT